MAFSCTHPYHLERMGNDVKDFPDRQRRATVVDARSQMVRDLKVNNDTEASFQNNISSARNVLPADPDRYGYGFPYKIVNVKSGTIIKADTIFEEVDVNKVIEKRFRHMRFSRPLFLNHCKIGYPLPAERPVVGELQEQRSGEKG